MHVHHARVGGPLVRGLLVAGLVVGDRVVTGRRIGCWIGCLAVDADQPAPLCDREQLDERAGPSTVAARGAQQLPVGGEQEQRGPVPDPARPGG